MSIRTILYSIIIVVVLTITVLLYLSLNKSGNDKDNANACLNCNVIIIGIDALRADHLGAYGYNRPTSPQIDKLAKQGIISMRNYSQSTTTAPSFMSLFTSLYPTDHGILFTFPHHYKHPFMKINSSIVTLPQILQENGYNTAAFVSSVALPQEIGFGIGFNQFTVDSTLNQRKNLLNWIDDKKNDKFFIFYHDMTVHDPYLPSEKYKKMFAQTKKEFPSFTDENPTKGLEAEMLRTVDRHNEEDVKYLIDLYDAGIRDIDEFINSLLIKLDNNGILDNTIIIFTSDHGEEFMDHGALQHLQFYNEILHVPLIIYFPSLKHTVIEQNTRTVDIFPTTLELLKIRNNTKIRGTSLLPIIIGSSQERPVISIMGSDKSIVWKEYKYINQLSSQNDLSKPITNELYDLKKDPFEKNNVLNTTPELKKELTELYEKEVQPEGYYKETSPIILENENETIEKLKNLGY